jgi:hypothetical protein
MRTSMLSITLAAFAITLPAATHAADIYQPAPGYSAAPPAYQPPAAYVPQPQPYAYAPPPPYAPPRAYPPGIVAVPEGPAYMVPGPAYQAGGEYDEAPALVDARRYHRDCWWEWGYRKCVLKPRWFW